MHFATGLSDWKNSMRTTCLIAGMVFVSMSGAAIANAFLPRCDTNPSKVCAKWAPGAPGAIAGKCIQWKWVHAQCVNKGRESWRGPVRTRKILPKA